MAYPQPFGCIAAKSHHCLSQSGTGRAHAKYVKCKEEGEVGGWESEKYKLDSSNSELYVTQNDRSQS